ncbi:putative receptor-like protein kinase [Tanacetum coccineum]
MLVTNVILFWLAFIFMYLTTSLADTDYFAYDCGTSDNLKNYTANSTFKRNLVTTFSNLPATNNGFGFCNLSTGQGIDSVYSVALCRGDINQDACLSCLNDIIVDIQKACPKSIYASAFADYCSLRYNNDTLLGFNTIDMYNYENDPQNSTNVALFNQALRSLLDKLKADVSTGDSLRKSASGYTSGPDFTNIYALMLCTPDLSKQECNDCLEKIIIRIPRLMLGKVGGRVLAPMCNLRYDLTLFFNESTPLVIHPPSSPQGKKRNTIKIVTIVSITLPFIGVIIIASLCIFMRLKKKKKPPMPPNTETMDIGTAESLRYEFSKVEVATNDFSDDNKLGQGGFGAVYKGVLEAGHQVAVKRLAKDSGQGDVEFKNEVLLLAKLQHRNLVRLLGFSTQGSERVLIYEFLPNASLDQFIFDS